MEPLIKLDDEDEGDGDHGNGSGHADSRFASSSDRGKKVFSSSSSNSGSDGEEESNWNVEAATKHLDNMIEFLDYQLNNSSYAPSPGDKHSPTKHNVQALPEFSARGGGIFDPPRRAAVHPSRPPPLELRPHPLRESELGRSLGTLTASQSHLLGGREDGSLLCWRFAELHQSSYFLSQSPDPTSPVSTLLADVGSDLVWSGHKDGRIRCWNQSRNFYESLCWVAHRGPVLSMIISSYGDLWSGSEGGSLRIWPWETLQKVLSLTSEDNATESMLVERSYIDLTAQFMSNSIPSALTSDVRNLLCDHARARVWSTGTTSFMLWDARTRDLLKVFNVDGQIERMDFMSETDYSIEEDMNARIIGGAKKEKNQYSLGFFQRSRNALIGAADAVRRVAAKGGFVDDDKKIEALTMTLDGMIWSGCANGVLVQWDGNGNRVQDLQYHNYSVQCFSSFGARLWVGYASGSIQVLNLKGGLLAEWVAHNSPVIRMATGPGYVFTLANHGGVRGWNTVSPGLLENKMRSALERRESSYTRVENVRVLTATWNVAQEKASPDSLVSWLGSAAEDVGIVIVGLQEVEMGAGVLAMSAAKETVGLEGSSVGQWWLDIIGKTLKEGQEFDRVGSRQLAGLLIGLWVRIDLRDVVGDIDAAAVPCGFGRAIGNKGAVGLRIRIFGRSMCFVNCHFAAHTEAVNRRNADFEHVYRTMSFGRASSPSGAAAGILSCLPLSTLLACSMFLFWFAYRCGLQLLLSIAASVSAFQMFRIPNVLGSNPADEAPDLSNADMLIFLGDFNYRLDGITYDEAKDFISQRSFDWLKERDQLRAEMKAGKVFQGMREAAIMFPPTYKFDKYQHGLLGYDSGEKKRVPAWCDRILYRDSSVSRNAKCSLGCPVVAAVSEYNACMDVTDSDHKPVRCIFEVDIARVDESVRLQEYGEIVESEEIKGVIASACTIPETIVSTNSIILQDQDATVLRITNKSNKDEALFEIICEGEAAVDKHRRSSELHSRGSYGFPRWLEVMPAVGTIKPYHIAEVVMRIEDFPTYEEFIDGVSHNSWCEDARNEEATLVVKIRGEYSTSESKDHRISVRHLCSSVSRHRTRSNGAAPSRGNTLQRSDYQQLSDSSHVIDDLMNLRS